MTVMADQTDSSGADRPACPDCGATATTLVQHGATTSIAVETADYIVCAGCGVASPLDDTVSEKGEC